MKRLVGSMVGANGDEETGAGTVTRAGVFAVGVKVGVVPEAEAEAETEAEADADAVAEAEPDDDDDDDLLLSPS